MHKSFTSFDPALSTRILNVDDDLVVSASYESFFRSKGADVVTCGSVASATNTLVQSSNVFDVVILSSPLFDTETQLLLSMLRDTNSHVVVIMIESIGSSIDLSKVFDAGINDYMTKPINLELLWIKIGKILQQQKSKALSSLQYELARHLFENMFHELNQPHAAVHTCYKPENIFSGDAALSCMGRDGSWYFMLVDTVGVGIVSAMSLMPLLQGFKAMSSKALPLANIVLELNNILHRLLPHDRFVAAVLLKVSRWSNQFEVWNGGMPDVFLIGNDNNPMGRAVSKNMALGALPETKMSVAPEIYNLSDVCGFVTCSDRFKECLAKNGCYIDAYNIVSVLSSMEPEFLNSVTSESNDLSFYRVDFKALPNASNQGNALNSIGFHPLDSSFGISFTVKGKSMACADIPGEILDFLLSQNLPQFFVQKVFTVCTEVYVNAFEHGVLNLDSKIKDLDDGFIRYYEEKELRIINLSEKDCICVELEWEPVSSELIIDVIDSGSGFSCAGKEGYQPEMSGRGFSIINALCESVDIFPPGNHFKLKISLNKMLAKMNVTRC